MLEEEEKEKLNTIFEEQNKIETLLLSIKTKPQLKVAENEEGMELNDGYIFELNGAIPEVADAIAKFAIELDNNGFGENASEGFIHLINNYFRLLKENKE